MPKNKPKKNKTLDDFWWNSGPDSIHQNIWDIITHIRDSQTYYNERNLRHLRLYGGNEIVGLGYRDYARDQSPNIQHRVRLNIIKSVTDTLVSKIAKNKPRPMFLTEGEMYSKQQKAKKLTAFVEGIFQEQKIYEKGPKVLTRGCVFDIAGLKFYEKDGKAENELVFPDQIMVDEREAIHGNPKSLFQVMPFSRDVLSAMYPDSADDIESSKTISSGAKTIRLLPEMIEVIEAWHLPCMEDKSDGRHVISINGSTLLDEKWEKDYFPFVLWRFSERLMGFYGQGLAEQLTGIQIEINKVLKVIQRSVHACSVPRVLIDATSRIVTSHLNNEIGSIIKYKGSKPEFDSSNKVPQELFTYLAELIGRAYEIVGISQLSAQAKKPAGLDSGAALREHQDIESDRFTVVQQSYEEFFMDCARMSLNVVKDIVERDGDYAVKHKSSGKLKKITWKEIALSEDEFSMQLYPTGMLPRTPAGRYATVQDMINGGLLEKEDALKLLDFPDVESVTKRLNARGSIMDMIEEEIIENGNYLPPEPMFDLQFGVQRMTMAYLQAKVSKVEEPKLEMIRNWIDDAQGLMEKAMANQQPPPPLPQEGLPPEGPPPPGAGLPAPPQQALAPEIQ